MSLTKLSQVAVSLFTLVTLVFTPVLCEGQTATGVAGSPVASAEWQYSIEDLNLIGAASSFPRISDTLLGDESPFRRTMFGQGLVLRANAPLRYSQNLLDGPVAADQQGYLGQRPTPVFGTNVILTADLRQLRLHHAQLNIGGSWKWSTWVPAGPKVFTLSNLYLYKAWADRRVEMKVGYIYNDMEFMGLQIGGSAATAAQGVYAVLPNQVGMSYYPLPAPSLNLKVRGPRRIYWKGAAQRSLEPGGAAATLHRNSSGLRFWPKGDKLLLINELGYQRASSATSGQVWIRGGFLNNNTPYANKVTGAKEADNYCGYVLADVQITQAGRPSQGYFVGGSYMTAPAKYNSYSSYYEARVYERAPFRSRPDDLASLVGSYRGYSKYVTGALARQNKSLWHSSTSLTASYSLHISRGNYLSMGLSYVYGPTITPRASNPLTANLNWSLYL